MTILVTGAKGMIGSQLVNGLLNAGYVVIGVDRIGLGFETGVLAVAAEPDRSIEYLAELFVVGVFHRFDFQALVPGAVLGDDRSFHGA